MCTSPDARRGPKASSTPSWRSRRRSNANRSNSARSDPLDPGKRMDPIETVKAKFADQVIGVGSHANQAWIDVKRDRIVDILKTLRDEGGYDLMTDLTAVDYLNQGMPERFCVVYNLYSVRDNVGTR